MSSSKPHRGREGRSASKQHARSPRNSTKGSAPSTYKFKGNCSELTGYVFDCSDYKQADIYTTTVKRVADHVGAEYKHGGDIRSSINNETRYIIEIPKMMPLPATNSAEEKAAQETL